jgi:DNA repair exonuclease SbcCD ATPase subunit
MKLQNRNLVGETANEKDDHIFQCHDKIEALEAENARLELKLAYHEKVRTKLLNEKDAEIRRLRQEKSELVEILRKLREASHHSPEVDWLGDDDPWEEADAALAKGGELIL